jgi:hypothetical protein
LKGEKVTLIKLEQMTNVELLQAHGAVIDELIRRDVVRTRNNPIGDYTEWLVCDCLGLDPQNNSTAAFDAVSKTGDQRYQIKGRQSDAHRVQFSAIRNLEKLGFDFVIAVVFNKDYSIRFAAKLTHAAVQKLSRHQGHVNAHILMLSEDCFEVDGVEDIGGLLCD